MAELPQRWNHRTKSYEPSCVVNTETGERVYRWPIDCDEIVRVSNGLWQYAHELPSDWQPAAKGAESAAPAPEPAEPVTQLKRGPGRPRREKPHEE